MTTEIKQVSSRLDLVKPSASAWVSQAAKKLKSQGHDVIDMGLGEPDFDTPAHIIEAAYQAAKEGQTRYPPTGGTATLKQAVADKFKRENQLSYSASQIIVSNGAKQVIFNALMATLEAGQEVLLCAPYFGQYKDMVLILGGKPVELECHAQNDFLVTAEAIDEAITSTTRWILLNAPSNPSGALYSQAQLTSIGEAIGRHPHVMVMADEIYEHIVFDGKEFISFAKA